MPGNPFRGYLQSYLENIQAQHRQEQAEKAHELAVNQLEELHQYHQSELKRQQSELDFRKNQAAQTLKQHLMENLSSGMQQPPESAGLNNPSVDYGVSQTTSPADTSQPASPINLPQTHTLVGPTNAQSQGYNYTLSPEDLGGLASSLSPADRNISVASPERMSQLAATGAGQKTAAEEAAKAPGRESALASKETVARIAAEQRAKTAEDKNASLIDRMNHIDATRKYVADHNIGNNVDEGELSDYVDKVANGEADLKDVPSKFRIHAGAILHNQGKVEFGKAKGDQVRALNDFDGLIQDMHTAANMLPDTTQGLQQIEQVGNVLKSHMPWQTDLASAMAAVSAKAPGIIRSVGGLGSSGRVTNVEIQQKLKDMVNAGMSKKQAEQKIAQFERDTYTKAYSDLMGNVPTKQKVAIFSKYGGLDRWRGINVLQKDGTVGPVIKKMPNGHEAMYNPNKDNYEDIEDYK